MARLMINGQKADTVGSSFAVYSAEEQAIGEYFGETLYQTSRIIANVSPSTYDNWASLISLPNAKVIKNIYGVIRSSTGTEVLINSQYFQILINGGNISYLTNSISSWGPLTVEMTVEYLRN